MIRFPCKEDIPIAHTFIKMDMAKTPEGEGHPFGMPSKWLFGVDFPDDMGIPDDYMFVRGHVRWMMGHIALWGFINYFLKKGALPDMIITYCEMNSDTVGKYVYKDGELTDSVIPATHSVWDKPKVKAGDEIPDILTIPEDELATMEILRP